VLNDLTDEQKARLRGNTSAPSASATEKKSAPKKSHGRQRRTLWYWLAFGVLFIGISAIVSYVSGSSRDFTTYTAPDGSFSASFPGTPQVSNNTQQIQGVSVPSTEYETDIHSDNIAYMVQVVNYPTDSFDMSQDPSSELHGAVSGMVNNSGATLVSESDNETFQGYDAAEATLSVTQDGQGYSMYTMNFIKGNALYTLMTIGETQGNYNKFIKSFALD
jgi:hypothetical protein